jgi:hypothetical protein
MRSAWLAGRLFERASYQKDINRVHSVSLKACTSRLREVAPNKKGNLAAAFLTSSNEVSAQKAKALRGRIT